MRRMKKDGQNHAPSFQRPGAGAFASVAALSAWNEGHFFLKPHALAALDKLAEDDRLDTCLPDAAAIFRAFTMLPPGKVRVVILGQDPYPNAEDAMGLAFSSPAARLPASLRNILRERADDLGKPVPTTGDLSHWITQGVLLANTALTIGPNGGSHFSYWLPFTRAWITSLAASHPLVWILWGKHAQSWTDAIHKSGEARSITHTIIDSAHPSPLSAYRGFFGSRPFSRTNQALQALGHPPIEW